MIEINSDMIISLSYLLCHYLTYHAIILHIISLSYIFSHYLTYSLIIFWRRDNEILKQERELHKLRVFVYFSDDETCSTEYDEDVDDFGGDDDDDDDADDEEDDKVSDDFGEDDDDEDDADDDDDGDGDDDEDDDDDDSDDENKGLVNWLKLAPTLLRRCHALLKPRFHS